MKMKRNNSAGMIEQKNKKKTKRNFTRAGGGGDFDPVHNPVDRGPDAQHFTVAARGR